ncbi:NADH dehydrogenase subunit N [Pontibacter ummariensis]|uniref:NADH-quinone oxidoreductase subunit N n=1 Tax=Pontibacter ummariensis TaxID=1610492 RepID=A0A239GKR7_9BACT|nr:NADH-quinone oxidoreductase subunit N [Pontibacter ummariensis]PRY11321.1 NADH dehydrogenase subunit N [Pontibacter ummariensis]SNS69759.1 NADH dehydrogenase subunit N [Pontibacter ummariensis]
MSQNDFLHLMPLLILTFAALLIMLVIAAWRNHKLIYVITAVSFVAAFLSLFELRGVVSYAIEPLLVIDGFALFYIGLILATALLISMLSYAYFEQQKEQKEEYYILLTLATLGACVLVVSTHFASLFLGLEVLSVSLYALVSYLRVRERSDEAGIKYLILAAFSSAFLLFGMALVYFSTGTMTFAGIATAMATLPELPLLLLTGFGMMIIGIGFKLSVVPFHMWTPDVYEGAPAPVTAFVATVSKGGVLGLLIRFFMEVEGFRYPTLMLIFTIVAIASMFAGNLLALMQQNVKRILAYSSISHLGYLLVAFLAGNRIGMEAVTFYLVAYFITTVGAFGTVALLSGEARDAEQLEDYRGLLWRRPWTATVFTAMLLSLAGIPLTAGFVGKFYVLAAGVNTQQWLLVVMLVLNSVIGLYYYIKIIAVMYQQPDTEREPQQRQRPSVYVASVGTLAVLAILLVLVGVYPTALVQLIQDMLYNMPAVVAR